MIYHATTLGIVSGIGVLGTASNGVLGMTFLTVLGGPPGNGDPTRLPGDNMFGFGTAWVARSLLSIAIDLVHCQIISLMVEWAKMISALTLEVL